MNPELLRVAVSLLDEYGWEALNLDRIAARAGVSRATVWRHGITRTSVERELRQRLVADYRELLGAPFATAGHGRAQLAAALGALCQVAERSLPLLAHTETAFHGPDLDAAGIEVDYFTPWLSILKAGEADGSLGTVPEPARFITLVTDMVFLTYVHLRSYHADYGWQPANTTDHLVRLVADGYLPRYLPDDLPGAATAAGRDPRQATKKTRRNGNATSPWRTG